MRDRVQPPVADGAGPAFGRVLLSVTGSPAGEQRLLGRFEGGSGVADTEVVPAGSPAPAFELSVTMPAAEAAAIASGELDPSVAFMRGQLKTAGDPGLALDLLAATASTGVLVSWIAGLLAPGPGQ